MKVATPATAFTVAVPPTVAPAGPVRTVAVTAPVNADWSALSALRASTTTAGASTTPATCVALGGVVSTSWSALPPVAVALTVSVPRPGAVTERVCAPLAPPSVHAVEALPVASVAALVGSTAPPPLVTAKVSVIPPMPLPCASLTRTTMGCSADEAAAVWPPPLTRTIWVGRPATTVKGALAPVVSPDALAVSV